MTNYTFKLDRKKMKLTKTNVVSVSTITNSGLVGINPYFIELNVKIFCLYTLLLPLLMPPSLSSSALS